MSVRLCRRCHVELKADAHQARRWCEVCRPPVLPKVVAGASALPAAAPSSEPEPVLGYREGRVLRKEEAQARFLEGVARGLSVRDALAVTGRSFRAYETWRERDTRFRVKADAAKGRARLERGDLGRGDSSLPGLEFIKFRDVYFGHSSPQHHVEMINAVEGQEPDSISLVLAPPESAKTSLMVDWINYRLGPVDPNWRICVMAESRDLSRKILGQVADRMLDESMFADYVATWGPFKAATRDERKGWNADYLTVLRASHDEKEPSIEARGAGSRVYGARYDKIHLDDIQSLETLGKTRALLDMIRLTLISRLAQGKGSMSIWGSRVGSSDIYSALLEEGIVDHLVRIPVLTTPLDRDLHFLKDRKGKVVLAPDCPEVSYWPEYWSMLALARKRDKVGERVWAQTYMQQGVSDHGAAFPLTLVQSCLDRDLAVGKAVFPQMFCSLDPALTGNAAFGVWAWDKTRLQLVHMEAISHMGNNENIFRKVQELSAQFRPAVWVIEQDGQGNKALVADERLREIARAFGFEVRPHLTSGNKSSHAFGVAAMATSFARQEFVFPYSGEGSLRQVDPLVAELVAWRPDVPVRLLTQDRVIACWIAWRYWMDQRNVTSTFPRLRHTPSWAA